MKNMKIKLLSVMISALLCSQLWAQGSESVSAESSNGETAKRYEKTYTITVKLKNDNYTSENTQIIQNIGLTTVNGKTTITSGSGLIPEPGCSYSAFFIADDGTYYGFDYKSNPPDGQYAVWMPYTKEEQKNYVKQIYKNIIGKNCQLSTETENILEDVGYTELSSSDLAIIDNSNFIRTGKDENGNPKNNDFDKLYIYNEKKGIFFLAVEQNDGNAKIVCFRDKQSKAEIIDNLNENDFKNWLNASKETKEINEHNDEYKRLSKLIYESLKNHDGFKNLYSDKFEKFYKIYLQVALNNNKNVYFSELSQKDKTYNPENYKINISANKQIKDAAQEYTNLTIKKGILFWTKTINLSFDYKDNQSDTPDIYKLKYQKQKDNRISDTVLSKGCDDIGFLNGILYSSFKSGDIKVKDNDKLTDTYDQYEKEIKDLKKKNNNIPVMKNVIQSLEYDELNKISIVIPELKDVMAGDIIFFIKNDYKRNERTIQTKKKCAVIMEDGNISKKVEDFQVIIMDEEKGAIQESLKNIWKTKDSFEIPEITEIRRILTVGQASNTNINWNVLNENVANETIEVLCMREDFQTSGEKFRFIPNTGEYLSMEKIRLNAYNQFGIQVRGDEWKVTINGAKDRNYKSGNTDGNVYNNSECNFNIKVGEKTGVLSKTSNGNYKITWIKQDGTTDTEPVFEIKTKDNLLFYGSDALEIKIRPENAANVRPGDDLLLEFKLTKTGSTDKFITLSEKDYIAVYDKKMVWRANLYIDTPEPRLAGLDWNDAHPWNVPSNGNNGPDWWNADIWGNNQWNKSYNLQDNSEVTNLTSLPDGNGGQVVKYSEWTPVRNKSDTYSENVYIDRVSYDYPQQIIGNNKHINAWDSPFDFIWKLNEQKKAIVMNFSSEVQTINSNNSISSEIRTSLLKAGGKFPRGLTNNTSASNYAFISNKSVETLSAWNVTSAPDNRWRYYWKEHITSNNITQNAYVVGLGFIKESPDHSFNDVNLNSPNTEINFIDYRSAGTDCIGFVQRAASYQNLPGNTNSGRIYKWPQIDNGKIEENLDLDTQSRWNTWGYKTLQPERHRDSNYTKSFISISDLYTGLLNPNSESKIYEYMNTPVTEDSGPTEENFQSIKAKILKIIPGDIIQYSGSHIGTIESIDYNAIENANTVIELLKAINVIESCFSYRVNSLIIRNIYMGRDFLNDDTVDPYLSSAPRCSWLINASGKLRELTIERLLSN